MRFSLSFLVAGMAAAVMASADSTYDKVPRDMSLKRMVRRSPSPSEQTSQKLKSQVDAKCYAGCDYPGFPSIYRGQFSVYSQFTHIDYFQQYGCFPQLAHAGSAFTQITTVQAVSAGFGVIAQTLFAFGQWMQQQSVLVISTMITSFHNLCQTLSVFIVRVQTIGVNGGDIVLYTQTILAIQGFLTKCFSEFSVDVFIQAVGVEWTTFTTLFVQIIQFGQTCGFFSDPTIFIQQGINFQFFQQICGIPISSFFSVSVFQTQVTSCATFCSGFGQIAGFPVKPHHDFHCSACSAYHPTFPTHGTGPFFHHKRALPEVQQTSQPRTSIPRENSTPAQTTNAEGSSGRGTGGKQGVTVAGVGLDEIFSRVRR